ncbi:MAG: hypothetical protein WCO07_00955 [bacterium]
MTDNYKNTISDEIIAFLFSCRSTSIRRKILWERVQNRRKISNHVFNQSVYRLKKRGIVQNKNDELFLSEQGKTFFSNPYKKIIKKPERTKKVMIIFDIPEKKRKVRVWLRQQIKDWDFKMIQKSVWIGYGPLPEEFKERLKVLKVYDGVKVYNLQKRQ